MHKRTTLIAVVDDEESVRRAIGRLIRAVGFEVETFASGADFLRSLERRLPRCVVLDLRMPHMNGLEVQVALSESGADVPVVIITGDDSHEGRTLAFAQGALACLRKPVDDAALLEAIEAAVR